jgi:hypothetical protein
VRERLDHLDTDAMDLVERGLIEVLELGLNSSLSGRGS